MNWWKVLANLAAFVITGASAATATATTSTETAVAAGIVGILASISTALVQGKKADGNTKPVQDALDAVQKDNQPKA